MACGLFRVSHTDLKTRSFFTHVKASEERASTAFLSIASAPRSAAALTALGRVQRGEGQERGQGLVHAPAHFLRTDSEKGGCASQVHGDRG